MRVFVASGSDETALQGAEGMSVMAIAKAAGRLSVVGEGGLDDDRP